MLTDTYNSLKVYLYDRAVSPLLGSLLLSWSAWNYKFIMLLFSDLSYPDKLKMIETLYRSNFDLYVTAILAPILTSAIYIFIFPYPSRFVFKFSLKRQDELNKVKQEITNNQLITLEKSQEIRKKINEINLEHAQIVESLENKLVFITQKNSELEEHITYLNKSIIEQSVAIEKPIDIKDSEKENNNNLDLYIKKTEQLLLDHFDNNNNSLVNDVQLISLVQQSFHIKKYIAENIINQLIEQNFFKADYSNDIRRLKLSVASINKIIDEAPFIANV
ncbi:TPA: hypothetical protein I7738_12970 [Vibrio vulnificus]|nr:hypothetical protein [Vibrio vulnificus]HAS8419044.1 hypothetical protein [Vibrio vulnificus]